MKVSRILHAGYIFETAEARIVIDPIFENPFSGNCFAFPSVKFNLNQIRQEKFSAIFISHFHDDHCSFESLDLFDRSIPVFIHCIHDEMLILLRELGFKTVRRLEFDAPVRVGDLSVIPRRPLDPDIDSMLQIKSSDLNVLNVVDSVTDHETLASLSEEGRFDLVLWPFQTMREIAVLTPSRANNKEAEVPVEWIDELTILSPRFLVPSSCQFIQEEWSWYNHALFPISYSQFEEVMSESLPKTRVVRMDPGASFILSKESLTSTESLPWVIPVGSQDLDYCFDPKVRPPATSVIASKFEALTPDETKRILKFCDLEVLERYRLLDETPYFTKPRVWQLSVFDHSGSETKFHYHILKHSIEKIEHPTATSISWRTEVPISKLFAALERGETLTSMYVRVNDCVFSKEVEADLNDMDVLEDPLIRVLFNGRFGAYQKNQLRLLGARSSATGNAEA